MMVKKMHFFLLPNAVEPDTKEYYVPVTPSSTLILRTSIILNDATFRETVIVANWIIHTKNDFEPSVLKHKHFTIQLSRYNIPFKTTNAK
jgi:hypothetical protein